MQIYAALTLALSIATSPLLVARTEGQLCPVLYMYCNSCGRGPTSDDITIIWVLPQQYCPMGDIALSDTQDEGVCGPFSANSSAVMSTSTCRHSVLTINTTHANLSLSQLEGIHCLHKQQPTFLTCADFIQASACPVYNSDGQIIGAELMWEQESTTVPHYEFDVMGHSDDVSVELSENISGLAACGGGGAGLNSGGQCFGAIEVEPIDRVHQYKAVISAPGLESNNLYLDTHNKLFSVQVTVDYPQVNATVTFLQEAEGEVEFRMANENISEEKSRSNEVVELVYELPQGKFKAGDTANYTLTVHTTDVANYTCVHVRGQVDIKKDCSISDLMNVNGVGLTTGDSGVSDGASGDGDVCGEEEVAVVISGGVVCYTGTGPGSRAEFHCDGGYGLVNGSASLVCMEEGTWSGTAPKCIACSMKDLGEEEAPNVSSNAFSCGDGFSLRRVKDAAVCYSGTAPGSTAVYNCLATSDGGGGGGGKRDMNTARLCKEDGTWTGSDELCAGSRVQVSLLLLFLLLSISQAIL